MNLIYHFTCVFLSIFILVKAIFYGLYEINTQGNRSGGIAVICFSILIVVFSNIIVFFR